MNEVIQYIIRFLLGNQIPDGVVGYTAESHLYSKYRLVIRPSGFFDENKYGRASSLPTLPLQNLPEGIPLLFGSDKEETVDGTLVLHADMIAGTYFLISRYEEMARPDIRDKYGRFPGKESLPYRAGFLHHPLVDEYGLYLRNKLRQLGVEAPEEKPGLQMVFLTHDVDEPFFCRSWRSVVRETVRGKGVLSALHHKTKPLEDDPYYTFPQMFRQNEELAEIVGKNRCRIITFFKAGGNEKPDKPVYPLSGKDTQSLFNLCRSHRVEFGLHSSYQAGRQPEQISREKQRLEHTLGSKICLNRHHFLAIREPDDMQFILKAGIQEDFSMGYADVAGFRLGTCRPVYWINPANQKRTNLLLHPLTIMDCSLNEQKYMGLPYTEALNYCRQLIESATEYGGEVTLLWHNTSFMEQEGSYLKQLYIDLLNELKKA